ncbi:MAG TPA: M56 family metallopeptidase [Acidimicrobiales bacterium]
MSPYVEATALAFASALCVGPVSIWLDRASWTARAPRAAVVLWQSIGLSGALGAIGAGLAVATARFGVGVGPGTRELVDKVVDGRPLSGLGLPDALGLTLAVDVAIVLAAVVGIVVWRTVRTRSRHRRILDLVRVDGQRADGAILLDDPRATAYCLPGLRPRIVVSSGAIDLLASTELAAVVEHERGHAHERHGLVMLSLASLTEPVRWIPYARRAPRAVATLLEMAADDFATRRHEPLVLAAALVRMGEDHLGPRFTFCAGATAVPARVARLLADSRGSKRTALLASVAAGFVVAVPVLIGTR